MIVSALRICRSVDDPDLAAVIEACSELPEAIKAGIIAMVRAAQL
jgi:hypothetical protein